MSLLKRSAKKGQAMMIAAIFFLIISLIFVVGVMGPILTDMNIAETLVLSKGSYYASEAGMEDVIFRLKQGYAVSSIETVTINDVTASTTVTDISGSKQVDSIGNQYEYYRKARTTLTTGSGAAFHYGVQAGAGGVELNNSSFISGNLFSDGPITGSGNLIKGDAISTGVNGLIDNIHATGSAYARTIQDSTVDKNAYYQIISGTTVGGTSYPGSVNQATGTMPIPDSQIEEWKDAALAGGVINSPCPYNISSAVTLGPKKINCDLNVSGSGVLTLAGPLWVAGNISISNTSDVRIQSSLGAQSVAIIADNPAQPTSGGTINLSNSVEFFGSGSSNSYVLMASMNKSASQGGSVNAISISNSANGALLLYAPYGLVQLSNSVSLREVTAYKIRTSNTAEIIYQTGIANLLFSAGPGGGYTITSWKELEQ